MHYSPRLFAFQIEVDCLRKVDGGPIRSPKLFAQSGAGERRTSVSIYTAVFGILVLSFARRCQIAIISGERDPNEVSDREGKAGGS